METQQEPQAYSLETHESAPVPASYDAASDDVVGGTSEVHQKADDYNVVGQGI